MADYTRTTIKLPQEVSLSLAQQGNIKSKYKRHSLGLITSMLMPCLFELATLMLIVF